MGVWYSGLIISKVDGKEEFKLRHLTFCPSAHKRDIVSLSGTKNSSFEMGLIGNRDGGGVNYVVYSVPK